jgi:hypothetical protein
MVIDLSRPINKLKIVAIVFISSNARQLYLLDVKLKTATFSCE